jgi:hypothetical protein
MGGEGSVPIGHSIRAYNVIVEAAGDKDAAIPEEIITYMEDNEKLPPDFVAGADTLLDWPRNLHLHRTTGLVNLNIFEGGHEQLYDVTFQWLDQF